MSLVLMVSADFTSVSSERRPLIDKCLAEKNWTKITAVSTTWFASFDSSYTEESAIQTTVREFADCVKPNQIQLAIHVGSSRPRVFPPSTK